MDVYDLPESLLSAVMFSACFFFTTSVHVNVIPAIQHAGTLGVPKLSVRVSA